MSGKGRDEGNIRPVYKGRGRGRGGGTYLAVWKHFK